MRNSRCGSHHPKIEDFGPEPLVFNINHATMMNENFRTTLWTGNDMQMTLMSIPVGGDIEYADEITLYRAMEGRRYFGDKS